METPEKGGTEKPVKADKNNPKKVPAPPAEMYYFADCEQSPNQRSIYDACEIRGDVARQTSQQTDSYMA